MLEFEVKARVPEDALPALRAQLGEPERVERHVDAYYNHPCRDFRQKDEALRVRRVNERTELTYKGPRLDTETKTRRELTLALEGEGAPHAFLESLGFRLVAEVRKVRSLHAVGGFEVAVDEVEGLGAFVELERGLSEGADYAAAKSEALSLLSEWGLGERERRSYLELLLTRGQPPLG